MTPTSIAISAHSEHARLEREIEELSHEILERYEEVNILYRLCESFGDIFDEGEILDRLLEEAIVSVHARAGWIALGEGDSRGHRMMAHQASETPEIVSKLASQSMAENRILLVERARSVQGRGAHILSVPLPSKNGAIGALVLERVDSDIPFRSGETRLVSAVAAVGASIVENRRLARQMKEAERVQGEIEIARRIQQGLLPSEDPSVDGLQLAGLCRPAQDIGGDYFGYSHIGPGRFGITIADVSGHSIGAAIGMVMARCLIQSEAHRTDSPSRVATRVNELLNRDLTDPGMFVTAFLAVYEERTGTFHYTNAGHNPPLLYRAAAGTIESLPGASLGLGILPGTRYFDCVESLASGDLLALYTDGLTEARSPSGEMFGLERLKQAVTSCSARSARESVNALLEHVIGWRGSPEFSDDITLVVARKE